MAWADLLALGNAARDAVASGGDAEVQSRKGYMCEQGAGGVRVGIASSHTGGYGVGSAGGARTRTDILMEHALVLFSL